MTKSNDVIKQQEKEEEKRRKFGYLQSLVTMFHFYCFFVLFFWMNLHRETTLCFTVGSRMRIAALCWREEASERFVVS